MKLKKILAALLALLMVTAMGRVASAAEIVTVGAGQTGTVSFTIEGVYGLDGEFTFTNNGLISGVAYSQSTGMAGNITNHMAYYYGATKSDITIVVAVSVSASAQPGDTIEVTFTYETADKDGNMSDWITETATIVVGRTSSGGGNNTGSGNNSGSGNAGDNSGSGTTGGAVSAVDYTELNKQITIAKTLDKGSYTADTWGILDKALVDAMVALESDSQQTVDNAAKSLADAIKGLVFMDYSGLEDAIAVGEELIEGNELGSLWNSLFEAIESGIGLLGSGDQDAVNTAEELIRSIIEELKTAIAEQTGKTETIVKEVPVEVAPEGDYCNITMHRVWPVLFFVSLALNVMFIGVGLVVLSRKKKHQDDIPLVDYEIDDDE